MQFALMIYHTPEEFAMRKNDYGDLHLGAWRACALIVFAPLNSILNCLGRR